MKPDPHIPFTTEPLIDRLRRATIGRYDIYAELGSGGMASVFLALDLALDRKVAIKVLAPQLASQPDNVTRFQREAKVAASLDHPNIIGILAVGEDPALPFFVMKYVEGSPLDRVIAEEGAQGVAFTRSVIATAGRALHFAHQRGVVHRDVKPANLMLDLEGRLIVTDFGIAKHHDVKGLTVTGSVIGTPHYMSPEQFNGLPVTGATDQYALGVVAFEVLTGQQPYRGETIGEVMRGHLFDPIPSARSLRPDVPEALDAVIGRMLAKDVADRFSSLETAVQAIEGATAADESGVRTQIIELARSGARARPEIRVPVSPVPPLRAAGAGRAAGADRTIAADAVRARTAPRRPVRRRFGFALAAAALLAVAGTLRPGIFGLRTADPVRSVPVSRTGESSAPVASPQPPTAVPAEQSAPPPASVPPTTRSPMPRRQAPAPTGASAPITTPTDTAAADSSPSAAVGTVLLGSRIALSAIFVNDQIRPESARGLQRLRLPAGPVRLSIRSARCQRWDTSFTVVAGTEHRIGFRPVTCERTP